MSKRIFNILLVCLVVFIVVYFSLKISQYGAQLDEADQKAANKGALTPYSYTQVIDF